MIDEGPRPPATQAQGERILLIDDNPEDIASLGELLRLAGHAVDGAADGGRALAIVRSWHPDLVIMDLRLPDGDALKVIRSIKAESPDTAVFAFSGWHQLRTPALLAGADAFVLKPDFDRLEQLLTKRQAARHVGTAKRHEHGS